MAAARRGGHGGGAERIRKRGEIAASGGPE